MKITCYSYAIAYHWGHHLPPSATICLQASSRSAMKQSFEVHRIVVAPLRVSGDACLLRQVRLMMSWEKWRQSPRTRVLASTSITIISSVTICNYHIIMRSHFWSNRHGCLDHYMIFPSHFHAFSLGGSISDILILPSPGAEEGWICDRDWWKLCDRTLCWHWQREGAAESGAKPKGKPKT